MHISPLCKDIEREVRLISNEVEKETSSFGEITKQKFIVVVYLRTSLISFVVDHLP